MTGGTFFRSYDGVSDGLTLQLHPATVGSFRLDRFEVTVGRFRRFKAAWDGGFRPTAGAGKHAHSNAGKGLTDSSGTATNESGWDPAWASSVELTDAALGCSSPASKPAWTATAGPNEHRPMACANWYEMYAFCIWDGGFLPSEAEWNYAASGGNEQRVYPWSSPPSSPSIDDTRAVYCGTACSAEDVGKKPSGDGRYGQADLAGSVAEWNLDVYEFPYVDPCDDCTDQLTSDTRGHRGGTFEQQPPQLLAGERSRDRAIYRNVGIGARCARSP